MTGFNFVDLKGGAGGRSVAVLESNYLRGLQLLKEDSAAVAARLPPLAEHQVPDKSSDITTRGLITESTTTSAASRAGCPEHSLIRYNFLVRVFLSCV